MPEKLHDAFISYSRKDKAFAALLEKALESFSPPKIGNISPKHLDVFRDEEDFTGTDYHKAVNKHLQESRKLILICSPAARASRYVNEEVRIFAEANGSDNIIPILLNGIPNNEASAEQDAEKAFPDTLVDIIQMPLAISYRDFQSSNDKVNKGKFDSAWFSLLANLYDIGRSEIEQRERKRQARIRNLWIGGLGSIIVILSGFLGLAVFNWFEAEKAKEAEQQATKTAIEQRDKAQHNLAASEFREAQRFAESNNLHLALVHLAKAVHLDQSWLSARMKLIDHLQYKKWFLPIQIYTHKEYGNYITFSKDGTRLITLSSDNTAQVWDAQSGKALGEPLRADNGIRSAKFSADGTHIVTISGQTVQVWDVQSSKALGEPLKHEDEVLSAEFSADGTHIVTISGQTVQVWDVQSSKTLGEAIRHESEIWSATLSGNGSYLVTILVDNTYILHKAPDVSAQIWDTYTGKALGVPLRHKQMINSIIFNGDGTRIVTTSKDKTAQVWDAQSGKALGEPLRHDDEVRSAEFSTNGTHIVTISGQTAQIWDVQSGKALGASIRHDREIQSITFSSDSLRVVTASSDNTARVWDALSGEAFGEPMRHEDIVYSAAFSPDGTHVVTASLDGTARIWDALSGKMLGEALQHGSAVYSAGFSADGAQVLTKSENNTAWVWSTLSGKALSKLLRYDDAVQSVEFSLDSTRVAIAIVSSMVRIWDAQSGKMLGEPLKFEDGLLAITFSPNGLLVAIVSPDGTTVRVWDVQSSKTLGEPLQHENEVQLVSFSSEGMRVATASLEGTMVRIWDVQSGKALGEPMRHESEVLSIIFSPDSLRVLTASRDKTARVWDTQSGKVLGEPLRYKGSFLSTTFSLGDLRLVIKGGNDYWADTITTYVDDMAWVWGALKGKVLGEPLRHESEIRSAEFSSDGTRVVTASSDYTVRIWDAQTGKSLSEPMRHEASVNLAKFSPDGTRVVTASEDKTARIWDVLPVLSDPENLLAELAEAVAGFKLSEYGSMEPLDDQIERLNQLRQQTANASLGEPTAESFVRWFLSDPWTRTISPLSKMTVPEYIQQEIDAGRREQVALEFPGHPLLYQNKTEEADSLLPASLPKPTIPIPAVKPRKAA